MDDTLRRILSLIPKKPDGKYVHGEKKKFCEAIGAPANIISEWESGKTQSYRNYLYVIAAKYNVSVEWLRGETDQKEPPRPEAEAVDADPIYLEIMERLKPLSRDDLLHVLGEVIELEKKKSPRRSGGN